MSNAFIVNQKSWIIHVPFALVKLVTRAEQKKDGLSETIYKICHDRCYVGGIPRNEPGHAGIFECEAIGSNGKCIVSTCIN
jgi:hypothetical protein